MTKIVATMVLVIVMIACLLVYPEISAYTQGQASPQLLTDWQKSGATTTSNYTATFAVASGTTYASLSTSLNATTETMLTLSWTDSATIVDATYQVRILEQNTVIYSALSAIDSTMWSVGGNSVSIAHSANIKLQPGVYTILYSLEGTNGNVTISSISSNLSIMNFVAQDIETFTPFLIVVALSVGLAAFASYQSSLKRELEHLETILRLSK